MLPEPAKNTTGIIEILTAVVADLIPVGGSTVSELFRQAAAKRIRNCEEILRSELQKGNISVLREDAYDFFVPSAYRFFEAVKEGEYEHNLRILAKIIGGNLDSESLQPPEFSRIARRIENLTVPELYLIVEIENHAYRFRGYHGEENPGEYVASASLLYEKLKKHFDSEISLEASLAELAGRGLLIPDGSSSLSKHSEFYYPSPFLSAVIKAAKSVLENGISSA